ncbi:FK506-binding protein 5-like [Ischnura elegans]|uniref:FK506-binding protein 5-like n=1 Tax=Ischnura elegans TaxID=197161 RepID=UPI001ED8AE3A|nr:FK506-binding protein 5-like [Ischnura elegans]
MRSKRALLHIIMLMALAFVAVMDVALARPSDTVEPLELLDYTDWDASEAGRQDDVDEGSPGAAGSEGTFGSWWSERRPCACDNSRCGCCTGRLFPLPPWLRPRVCTNLTYIEDEFAVKMAVTFNDVVMYRNKLSGRNPPPVCLSPPRIPRAKLCIKLQDVYLVDRNIHACMAVEGLFNKQTLFGRTLGCMRMGSNGFAVVNPEDGGGLPTDAIDPDDDDEPNDEDDYDQVDEEDYDPVDEDNTVESGGTSGDQVAVEAQAPVETTTPGGNKKKGSGNKVGNSHVIIKPFIKGKDDSGASVKTAGDVTVAQEASPTKVTHETKAETSPESEKQVEAVGEGLEASVKTAGLGEITQEASPENNKKMNPVVEASKASQKTAGGVPVSQGTSNTTITGANRPGTSLVNNKFDPIIERSDLSLKTAAGDEKTTGVSNTKVTDLNRAGDSPVREQEVHQAMQVSGSSVKTADAEEGQTITTTGENASEKLNEVVNSQTVADSDDVTEDEASTTSSTTIDGMANTLYSQWGTGIDKKTTTEPMIPVKSVEDKYSVEIPKETETIRDADEEGKVDSAKEAIEQGSTSKNQSETKGQEKLGTEGKVEEGSNAGSEYQGSVPEGRLDARDIRGLMDDEIVGIGTVEVL